MTFEAEDLTVPRGDQDSAGNSAVFINDSVGLEARNLMQKTLMKLFSDWGDAYVGKVKK